MVSFGNPGRENDAAARAEMLFQDSFWTADEAARAALGQGDYTGAELQLNKARDVLAPVSDGRRHESEGWQWMTSMGLLSMAQKKDDEAEKYYKKALELRQNGDQEAPEMAASLFALGRLYAHEKRYDLARDHAIRSVAIYQKNLKRVGSRSLLKLAFVQRADHFMMAC
jgi:tetratricopeptide (TPR) repeat protein